MLHLGLELFKNRVGAARWRVLQSLVSLGPTDIRTIATNAGSAVSTVRSYADQFMSAGILVGQGVREGAGGRPGQILGFARDAGYAVGVILGRQAIEVSLVDLNGSIVSIRRQPAVPPNPPSTAVQGIVGCVSDSLEQAGVKRRQLAGVGVAVEGLFYGPDDVWPYWPSSKSSQRIPLQSMLTKELGLPVTVEDQGRARLLVEARQGVLKNLANGVLVWVGTGIAAYFYFNGMVFRGASGMNGEFGHLIIEPDGPVCACGRRGCLEAVASVPSLEREVKRQVADRNPSYLTRRFEGHSETLTIRDILEAASLDDRMAYMALHQAGERLGRAISILLNTIGPMTLVLGGELVSSPVVLEAVRRAVKLDVVGTLFTRIDIQASHAGEEAGSFGAALLAIERAFSRPSVPDELLSIWSGRFDAVDSVR